MGGFSIILATRLYFEYTQSQCARPLRDLWREGFDCSRCLSGHFFLRFGLGPRCWRELFNLGNLRRWQPCEQILQIFEGIYPMPPATAQQGVNHGATIPSFRMPNEHPIAFPKCAGPNQVFQEVGVNFKDSVVHESGQGFPPFQGIVDGLTEQSLRQCPSSNQLHSPAYPLQHWAALPGTHCGT